MATDVFTFTALFNFFFFFFVTSAIQKEEKLMCEKGRYCYKKGQKKKRKKKKIIFNYKKYSKSRTYMFLGESTKGRDLWLCEK